jgi:fructose-1,6-bisphosphatase II
LGKWTPQTPRFNIALDPVDGTTNLSKGSPNAISVMAAVEVPENSAESVMRNIPSYYSHKVSYGPTVARVLEKEDPQANFLDAPLEETLHRMAKILQKRVGDLVVLVLDRPRNQPFIDAIRRAGASLRTIADGDITAAVAPSLPDSGIDLYVGIGGSPEGVLTATALRALGGEIQLRMWFPNPEAKAREVKGISEKEIQRIYRSAHIVTGESAIFCATGIIESPLLPGVKLIGHKAITHSILMRARSRTVRYIRAVHDLEHKTIHLRSTPRERSV